MDGSRNDSPNSNDQLAGDERDLARLHAKIAETKNIIRRGQKAYEDSVQLLARTIENGREPKSNRTNSVLAISQLSRPGAFGPTRRGDHSACAWRA